MSEQNKHIGLVTSGWVIYDSHRHVNKNNPRIQGYVVVLGLPKEEFSRIDGETLYYGASSVRIKRWTWERKEEGRKDPGMGGRGGTGGPDKDNRGGSGGSDGDSGAHKMSEQGNGSGPGLA